MHAIVQAVFFVFGVICVIAGYGFLCILMLFGIQTKRERAAWVGFFLGIISFVLAVFFLHAGATLSLRS